MQEGRKNEGGKKGNSPVILYTCVSGYKHITGALYGPFQYKGFPLSSILNVKKYSAPFHFVPLCPEVTSVLVKKEGEWRRQAESNRWQHNRRSL